MIDLSTIKIAQAEVQMDDRSAELDPVLGGVAQTIRRIGVKFALSVSTPRLKIESEGRKAIALLQQAKLQDGFIEYPQPDLGIGSPGSPTVNGAHTGGTTLNITGGTPHYVIRQNQALNLTRNGRLFLYFAATPLMLDGNGAGAVLLTTPMRTHLEGGNAVNLAKPVIAGQIEGGIGWTYEVARLTGLQFTIRERA